MKDGAGRDARARPARARAPGRAAAKRPVLAGVVDETLPPLGDLLPKGFDVQWLGAALGRYRASELARQTMPARDEELHQLRQALEVLRQARDLFAHQGLPPHGDVTAHALALALGMDWPALRRQLRGDLNAVLSLLALSAERLASAPTRRGRPRAHARDELLRELVHRLRVTPMPAADARALAEQVLVRCRVPVPADGRALQRAANVKG